MREQLEDDDVDEKKKPQEDNQTETKYDKKIKGPDQFLVHRVSTIQDLFPLWRVLERLNIS